MEDELREKIGELRYGASKDRENNVPPNERQHRIDNFMIDMSGRLTLQREELMREGRVRADQAQPEINLSRGVTAERDRVRPVIPEADKAEAAVKDRIAELRDGMIKAVQHIEKGREPDMAFLDGPEKSTQPEFTPERAAELQAEIARLRTPAKPRDHEPDR